MSSLFNMWVQNLAGQSDAITQKYQGISPEMQQAYQIHQQLQAQNMAQSQDPGEQAQGQAMQAQQQPAQQPQQDPEAVKQKLQIAQAGAKIGAMAKDAKKAQNTINKRDSALEELLNGLRSK